MRLRTFTCMERGISLVLWSVIWSGHPVWDRSRPGKAFCARSDDSFLRKSFMNFFGKGKVNAIEQAMAFGFLSYWKGRECIGCCPKICTVLARCLVFYLHMHVYMLFGMVMLKPTLRYIEEIVNSLFRITVGQILKILPVSLSVKLLYARAAAVCTEGFRRAKISTKIASRRYSHTLVVGISGELNSDRILEPNCLATTTTTTTNTTQPPVVTTFPQKFVYINQWTLPRYHDAVRVIRSYSFV